jgi:DNA polymerase IV (DinB-like DNA polymerase)
MRSGSGSGPGFIVAKIASDFRKPGGLTVVPPGEVREFLAPLPVRKIPGVGMKSSALLLELGIRTIADLARVDVQELTSSFGKWGAILHDLARGNDADGYRERGSPQSRSIGRETTFEQDSDDPDVLAGTLAGLSSAVSGALRDEGLTFRTVTVKMRFSGFETRTRSRTLDRPAGDKETVRRLAGEIAGLFPHGRKVRLVGVRLSGLSGGASAQKELSEF